MGIYIQVRGRIPPDQVAGINQRLIDSARRWSTDAGLAELFYAEAQEDVAFICIYPPAGCIRFDVKDGTVEFDVKTSIVGPGYHAAVITLCDHLKNDVEIDWQWYQGSDDTEYARQRSMPHLMVAFEDQFSAFCDGCKESSVGALNLEIGLAASRDNQVATPLGYLHRQFFVDAWDDPDEMGSYASQFFMWWLPGKDQAFWNKTLRGMLWTDVEWRAPRTNWEEHIHRVTLALGARLRPGLDKETRDALDELAILSAEREKFITPTIEGIGFRRGMRTFDLSGPWTMDLPGYYIEQDEGDGTLCFWFGDEEVRASSFNFGLGENNSLTWGKLQDEAEHSGKRCVYRLESKAEPSEHHPEFFNVTGEFQMVDDKGKGHLLVISVFSSNQNVADRLAQIAKTVDLNYVSEPLKSSH